MLKIYVYDQVKDAWIEEENLLFEHDTCAILNEKDRKIYLWKGPKCNSKKYKRGRLLLKNLIEKFEESNVELIHLGKDIPPFVRAAREPASYAGINSVGLRRRGFSNERISEIQDIYRIIFNSGLNYKDALRKVIETKEDSQDKEEIINYIKKTERGLIKS